MKVHLIKTQFDAFQAHLQNKKSRLEEVYKYDIIQHFNEQWTFDGDLADVIDRSLRSEVSRRIWRRENFDAKNMMLVFAKEQPDYCYQMYKDLFDETRAIDARIDRFKFYCDELFQLYRQNHPRSIETSHDQDAIMISMYLSGKYPDQYAIYPGLEIFSEALIKFEANTVPVVDDLDRFFKSCRAIQTLAQKEDALLKVHAARFDKKPKMAKYRQFSSEFIAFVGKSKV